MALMGLGERFFSGEMGKNWGIATIEIPLANSEKQGTSWLVQQ